MGEKLRRSARGKGKASEAQKPAPSPQQIVARARQDREAREAGYRAQALKLYPWVCGRCAREFDRTNLRELTVHHRDHNHDNNPGDGSNWELLCVYCHDNEHSRYIDSDYGSAESHSQAGAATHSPFAGLADLLKGSD
ncbi:YajD family HNH nuclease [Aestuariirhabdus litorea]|uniref:Putative HNH nuclease YajD n=1 Tax=Aestuariirhabdus litorea TaxID=2528527 RepID=A0A3P3VKB7_9GAMM|nr:YajD family HNH nuclease [Aestuariirhabdus litorea]RRJ82757.1 HNH nuclease family protein [Aestuariirhabdus litorea]RWW92918.1 HNH nuclease family protein [Endozoicomonadaceae bacterium GTF-13]